MNHVRLVKPIGLQKGRKLFRQWNRPLFSVLKLNPFVFAEMQKPCLQIKPGRLCLHNLV
jgi:hypothetical protein